MREADRQRGRRSRAIALGYERERQPAPRVLAAGSGQIAERILERAQGAGIPIERDSDLVECLSPLMVGESIPLEAFEAVARILAFLYELNGESGERVDSAR